MTGAIFCERRPATIMRSAWRGDGRKTSAPKRARSKRAAAMDIISMAQQASPKPSGQMELLRAQFTALSRVVKMMPSSSRRLPKSSGLVSVTCLPRDVLIVPRLPYFRIAKGGKQIGIAADRQSRRRSRFQFDHEDDGIVAQAGVGPEKNEEIREAADGYAEIGGHSFLPGVVNFNAAFSHHAAPYERFRGPEAGA